MQSAEPVLDVQPRLCRGKVAGEPGDRKRSCRGSGEGALEKGLERHLAGVPISPRSKRTRASRRGRHRISRPRRPSSIPACPTAFSTQEFPCARCPLLREPGGNSCGKDFHAPNLSSPALAVNARLLLMGSQLTVAVLASGPIRSKRLTREGLPSRPPGYTSVRERLADTATAPGFRVRYLVNDRLDVAVGSGANGVHLGQGEDYAAVRSCLGTDWLFLRRRRHGR